MWSGVYKIHNRENNRLYIGSSWNINVRWDTHKTELRHNKHANEYLQRAWNLYGEAAFKFSVVELVDERKDLLQAEQFWLDYYRSYEPECGYNIARFAHSSLGIKRSPESCRRNGLAKKGKAPWNKGKKTGPQPLATRLKRRVIMKGNTNGFKRGGKPWNTGLTKETSPLVAEIGEKIRAAILNKNKEELE